MFQRGETINTPTPHLDRVLKETDPVEVAMGRRTVLRVGGGVLVAFALAETGANMVQAEKYGSHGTTLRIDCGRHIKSKFLIVSFGGLGSHDDFYGATTLFKASGNRIPAGDMLYDDMHGIDTRRMARVLRKAKEARKFEYLILNLDSLGAEFGLQAAYEAGIPVAGMVINCGPPKLADATTGSVLLSDIVASPRSPKDTLTEDLELVGKNLGSFFRDTPPRQWRPNLLVEIATLPSQMTAGASAPLQNDELVVARGIDDAAILPRMYKRGLIHPRMTVPVFLDTPRDLVADDRKSYLDWKHDLSSVGMALPLLHMGPGSVHADEHAEGPVLQRYGFFDEIIELVG